MNNILQAVNLVTLPLPKVIESLDFEEIFSDILEQFVALVPEYQLLLESDPAVKVIEAWAYRELLLRERINVVGQANFIALATGTDLDNVAAFYDVQRLVITEANPSAVPPVTEVLESDDALRLRTQLKIRAKSTAGSWAHYKYWAMTSDPRVKDAAVYSPDFPQGINMGGKVNIAIMSTELNGVPSEDLMTQVRDVVGRNDIKVLTDIVEVLPATQRPFSVVAEFTLYPNVPVAEIDAALLRLQAAFALVQNLGRDVTHSWLIEMMKSPQIYDITILSPVTNLVVAPNEYPILTSVIASSKGYSDSEGYGVMITDEEKAMREVNALYVKYATENNRTVEQIMADLVEAPITGVMQPTVRGIAEYLNLVGTKNDQNEWLPEDEISYLIWRYLNALSS